MLLTPKSLLKRLPDAFQKVDYIQAQLMGSLHGDCSEYAASCDWRMFDVVDSFVPQNYVP